MSITRELCAAIERTKFDDFPADAIAEAKLCLLDWLGVTLGGANEPLTRILIEVTDSLGGKKQASIIGHARKSSMLNAALINGSASHALDFDDVHFQMMGHPTVPVMPAVLALAETRKSTGKDMFTAFILGFEAECRIGSSVLPFHYQQGWHATSTIGRFGAAAACAKLLGLDTERMNYSIGIAGTQAAGLKQVFGTMSKPFHAGKAAADGLLSALLAEKGFTCSEDILAGEAGFCKVLSPDCNPEMITQDFGKSYAVTNVIFKRHASCFETHPTIDAALELRTKVLPEEVKEVIVEAVPIALEIAGKPEPRTGLEGKFSLAYCAALALVDGQTGEERFTNENVLSDRMVSMRQKVKVNANEDFGLTQATVVVRTNDGREFKACADTLEAGSDKERRKADLIRKFRSFADRLLPPGRTDSIIEFVESAEKQKNVAKLLALCRP
ncbi:MAG: MmgE/PrpD family protein [Candidatus Abyssobacteria bacterium SURF_17]|uniref:MmgE/PrpD family protein n=1 Tax=Candidatus Abyssobacteria bacterium SURF_17 TaxID=2093361 RepID=A0A419F9L6_9BACT|nr:MAG: MmgE/PrpD family protein [Candidatus Abyssubacteria bacterium SURF_17]